MLDNQLQIKIISYLVKMNIYSVYADSSKKNKEPILIKQGFSFIAAFFNFFWVTYHKMWLIAISLLAISYLLSSSTSSYIANCINFAILFIFGFFASDIREYYARKKGYNLSDVILASNEEEAEVKYFERTKTLKHL